MMFLPFRNVTRRTEQDWLVSGAPLMLAQALGQFRDLQLVPEERLVAARRRLRIAVDSVPDAAQVRRIAEETGGWTAVTGNIFATGPRLRVTLQATDVPTGRIIARAEQEADAAADLRATFDALSVRLLEPAGVPATGASLIALTTRSVDAYRAYLRGIDHHRRSEFVSALSAFQDAVRLDSTFALGWSSMAFMVVNTRGFQEMMSPGGQVFRAIERAARQSQHLPRDQAALIRALQAFTRAQIVEARRIADSLLAAEPQNLSALELAATMYSMTVFVSPTISSAQIARDANHAVRLVVRLLELDPGRRMTYAIPVTTYGFAGGLWWGQTWADTRQFTSLPFMLMAVSSQPQAAFVPLYRDSLVFVPLDSFRALPDSEKTRLRRPGADRAMLWVREWLAAGPDDAEAHLWASRIAELQGEYRRALKEFAIADSIGIQTGVENPSGRRLSLLVLSGDYARAGAYADSLLDAGAMNAPPFIAFVDRRWTYGAAALLLSRRWESVDRLTHIVSARRAHTRPCESLGRELAMAEAPAPAHVRQAVMDTVRAHLVAFRATSLAPCERAFSGGLNTPP